MLTGIALLAVGVLLAATQVFTPAPQPALLVLGLVLAFAGALVVSDHLHRAEGER